MCLSPRYWTVGGKSIFGPPRNQCKLADRRAEFRCQITLLTFRPLPPAPVVPTAIKSYRNDMKPLSDAWINSHKKHDRYHCTRIHSINDLFDYTALFEVRSFPILWTNPFAGRSYTINRRYAWKRAFFTANKGTFFFGPHESTIATTVEVFIPVIYWMVFSRAVCSRIWVTDMSWLME